MTGPAFDTQTGVRDNNNGLGVVAMKWNTERGQKTAQKIWCDSHTKL